MAEPRAIRVFLVDDQAVVRAGFRQLLAIAPGIEVVGEVLAPRALRANCVK